ncbi:MAG: manganese efflux pump [Deltaproteobacteria bacterium]|nr:manganese efflux pump [Deltaproteobacteria bacterium]
MDAFAVAVASGVSLKNVSPRQFFRLSWHFGLFQAVMPVIGWCAGLSVRAFIESYDHWVAFGLLAFVSVNMLRSALGKSEKSELRNDPTKGSSLVLLSVATSIDAFAVGLSMAFINVSIWFPALVIGIIASIFTAVGLLLGSRASRFVFLQKYAEFIGAGVLIAIGINILREHGALTSTFP